MKEYIEKMVRNLEIQVLSESKCKTPIHKAINEDGTSTPLTAVERHVFLCALGMTGWLNQTARPDIALAQSRIAQHCANPTQDAMDAVLHLISYLYHTRDLCIRTNLRSGTEQELLLQEYTKESADHGWSFHSDTDHAGNKEVQNHRRSQNGVHCVHMMRGLGFSLRVFSLLVSTKRFNLSSCTRRAPRSYREQEGRRREHSCESSEGLVRR